MFLVAVTGGIASGKSTVSRMFADLGCPVIDADLIAREGACSIHSFITFANNRGRCVIPCVFIYLSVGLLAVRLHKKVTGGFGLNSQRRLDGPT